MTETLDPPDAPDPVDPNAIYSNPAPGIISAVPDDAEERAYQGLISNLGLYHMQDRQTYIFSRQ